MDDAKEFINDFLQHYSSEFYDPVKAHEYYLKTRELKGREKKMTEQQKSAWNYAKGNIATAKKKELGTAADNNAKAMAMLRENATSKRDAISKKLTLLFTKIAADRTTKVDALAAIRDATRQQGAEALRKRLQKISDDATSKIDNLPAIPDGLPKEQRAKLVAERRKEIAAIRGEAFTARKAVSDDFNKKRKAFADTQHNKRNAISDKTTKEKDTARGGSNANRDAVATELKAGIAKARSNYQALKDSLKAKYEQKSTKEREAISRSV